MLKQTVILDADDFAVDNTSFMYFCELKRLYPKFKVSLFTVPMSVMSGEIKCLATADNFLSEIKEYLDWIEFIPHGFSHYPMEFQNKTYQETIDSLIAIERIFNESGLPFVKGFKAPYWAYNDEVAKALKDKGYWIALDKNDPRNDMPIYKYNWSINEPYPKDIQEVRGHAHIQNVCGNGIEECFSNLLTIPEDVEWKFISEVMENECIGVNSQSKSI